ncbi:MAG: T9SS type A sorting domain-containing protein [Flavobacteriales bacterium]|jgi:hypothetical protein|nr:T9SS type A sorting domain-containing protein [Flavobacteriales bacterium]
MNRLVLVFLILYNFFPSYAQNLHRVDSSVVVDYYWNNGSLDSNSYRRHFTFIGNQCVSSENRGYYSGTSTTYTQTKYSYSPNEVRTYVTTGFFNGNSDTTREFRSIFYPNGKLKEHRDNFDFFDKKLDYKRKLYEYNSMGLLSEITYVKVYPSEQDTVQKIFLYYNANGQVDSTYSKDLIASVDYKTEYSYDLDNLLSQSKVTRKKKGIWTDDSQTNFVYEEGKVTATHYVIHSGNLKPSDRSTYFLIPFSWSELKTVEPFEDGFSLSIQTPFQAFWKKKFENYENGNWMTRVMSRMYFNTNLSVEKTSAERSKMIYLSSQKSLKLLQVDKEYSLRIYNTSGQLVSFFGNLNNQQEIDFSAFPNALYIVVLQGEEEREILKVSL